MQDGHIYCVDPNKNDLELYSLNCHFSLDMISGYFLNSYLMIMPMSLGRKDFFVFDLIKRAVSYHNPDNRICRKNHFYQENIYPGLYLQLQYRNCLHYLYCFLCL